MSKPRVLFVDDDACLLDMLKLPLQSQAAVWNMEFVDSGQAALDLLDKRRIDVLVCDLHMPIVDGAAVLAHACRVQPAAVRVVLSGHTEHELTLESMHAMHCFLSKPVEANTVIEAIERSLKLRDTLRTETLVMAMSGLESVPSLPQIYDDLMAALAKGTSTAADIGAIVETDVGLSATILKLVNSSFYGLFRHVESPGQAAALLGTEVMKNIALTEKLFSQFEGNDVDINYFTELNTCSNMTGILASRLARQAGISRRSTDHCQIAGLMSRLGELLIEARLKNHPQISDGTLTSNLIGGYMLNLWRLPDPIVDAVTNQHCKPARAESVVTPTYLLHALRYLQESIDPEQETDEDTLQEIRNYLSDFLPADCAERWVATYTGWHAERSAKAA